MYYFKESGFIFLYSIMMAFMSLAAIAIEIDWVSYILCAVSIGFMLFIIAYDCFKEGQKGYKQLYQNDMSRKRIIETGEDIEINTMVEYKPYKGFLISFFAFIPMILFLLVHLIIAVSGGETNVLGAIANLLYLDFAAPIFFIYNSELPKYAYFIILYSVVISCAVGTFAYVLGGRKIELQYEKIKEKQKSIYGE